MKAMDVFIGMDVSKDTLDVAVRPTGEERSFANTEDGIGAMRDFIQSFSARLVVLEATGGDGRRLPSAPWRLRAYPWWW